jgi:hypothetical protein
VDAFKFGNAFRKVIRYGWYKHSYAAYGPLAGSDGCTVYCQRFNRVVSSMEAAMSPSALVYAITDINWIWGTFIFSTLSTTLFSS